MGDLIDRRALFDGVSAEIHRDWPLLSSLRLTSTQLDRRRMGVGGSDATVLLSANGEAILRLWREKRGESLPEDLSDSLAVMLGCWTEPFNRQWFERLTGQEVVLVEEEQVCAENAWRRCSPDGVLPDGSAIWEAKHTNAFAKPDEVLERYMPQLQHNMAVTKINRAYLSVIFGNHRFEIFEVASDWMYQIQLLDVEADFWDCVTTGRQPVPAPTIAAPKPVGTREVSLDGNNAWAAAAADWLKHRDAAKAHAVAITSIKSMVEDDVSRAFGHGIEAKRNKAGAISIREAAE